MKTELTDRQRKILHTALFADGDTLCTNILENTEPLLNDSVTLADIISVMPKAIRHNEASSSTYRLEITQLDGEWAVCYSDAESEFLSFIREELIDALFCVLVDIAIHEFIPL